MTYSSSLAANRQRFNAKSQNITSFKEKYSKIGPVSNTIILMVLVCVLGLMYLSQVTKTNSYSYQLNDLREQKTALESERAQLEIDSARLKSLARVKDGEAVRDFVSVAPTTVVRE